MNGTLGSEAQGRSAHFNSEVRRALGGLLAVTDDPEVRDVLVHVRDSAAQLWIDRGHGTERVPGWAAPPDEVRRLAVSLVAAGGRHLDELNPCADVRLGDGVRVHAVLAPVAVSGTVISIRLPGVRALTIEELAEQGLCSGRVRSVLERGVAQRRNILITGGTGSGKTTLLNALLARVPPQERIVSIEDVAELRPEHPHHISLEARQANIEGAGEVTLEQLLREALRMRPDRIVLGECRGAEIVTLLAAFNTGHEGGAGTLHANRIEEVPTRLEALGMLAGLSPEALARQATVLDLIVHVEREGGRHRVTQMGELRLSDRGTLAVRAAAVETRA